MSYVSENLMPNEKVYFKARIHPAIFIPAILCIGLGLLLFLATFIGSSGDRGIFITFSLCVFGIFLLSAVVLALDAPIAMHTTEFAVTNRRVIGKVGLFRRHTLEILLSKVESVAVHQNLAGRMLDFGTVVIVGTGGTQEPFRMIAAPLALRMKVNQILEASAQAYARTGSQGQ